MKWGGLVKGAFKGQVGVRKGEGHPEGGVWDEPRAPSGNRGLHVAWWVVEGDGGRPCDRTEKLEQHPESHREPRRDLTRRLSSLCVLEDSVANRREGLGMKLLTS